MSDRSNKIKEAFRLVLFDSEGKYDDCMVTRLFDMIKKLDKDDFSIIDKLTNSSYRSEDFTKVKVSSLLRLHKAVINTNPTADHNATNLTEKIPLILSQSGDSVLPHLLDLLHEYSLFSEGFSQVIARPFNVPIERLNQQTPGTPCQQILIADCVDLIAYCCNSGKNYYLQEKAYSLMRQIIMHTYCYPNDPFNLRVKKYVDDGMDAGNVNLYCCIHGIVSNKSLKFLDNSHRRRLRPIVEKTFERVTKIDDKRHLAILAAIMSYVTNSDEVCAIIEKLRNSNNFEAIIAFLSGNGEHSKSYDVLKYMVFPILMTCDTDNSHVMTQRLHMTREEKLFIERHKNDKHLTNCLKYIDKITDMRTSPRGEHSIIIRKQLYLFDVLIEYLECHHTSPRGYKNVLQCLKTLRLARRVLSKRSELLWCIKTISRLIKLIEELDETNPMHLPIIIDLVVLISDLLHLVTSLRQQFGLSDKVSTAFMLIVDLAFRFTHSDVLIEFVNLFSRSSFQFIVNGDDEGGQNDCYDRYVRLIWHHIKKYAFEGYNQELPGAITDLLIAIDLYIDPRILNAQNIQRRRDVPKYLGDVLNNYHTRIPTIEALVQRLRCAKIVEVDAPINRGSRNEMTYLCFLDCDPSHRTSANGLNHIMKGLCLAAKSEIRAEFRLQVIDEFIKLFDEFLINECNIEVIFKRLIKTGVVQTLYELSTNSLDSGMIKIISRVTIASIQKFIIDKLPDKRETLIELLEKNTEESASQSSCASDIADFYINKIQVDFEEESNDCCDISFDTYIDEIINQRNNGAHVSECY